MSIIDIKNNYDILFSIKDINELDITIHTNYLFNIKINKKENIMIIDHIGKVFDEIELKHILFYNNSNIKIIIEKNQLLILVDEIIEFIIEKELIYQNNNFIKTNLKINSIYIKKSNNTNCITINNNVLSIDYLTDQELENIIDFD